MRVIGFEVNHKNVDFMWLFRILNTLSFYIHGIKHGIKNNVLIEEYNNLCAVCGQIFKRFLEQNEITILLRTSRKDLKYMLFDNDEFMQLLTTTVAAMRISFNINS